MGEKHNTRYILVDDIGKRPKRTENIGQNIWRADNIVSPPKKNP